MMVVIYILSSTPSSDLPDYGFWDLVVKKGGHFIGYGMLATAYWFGFPRGKMRFWLAWCCAVLFALTDEFHQSFVPGRHAAWIDVLLFDATGAATALFVLFQWRARLGAGKSEKRTP